MMKLKFGIQFAKFIFVFLFALAICLLFSFLLNFWGDYGFFPDTLVHYDLAAFYSKYFPHINWWNFWGPGMPMLFFYPKILYIFETALRALTHWDMQAIVFGAIFTAIFLSAVFTALSIRIVTKSWLLSLIALPFFYGSAQLWEFRNFARCFAYIFFPLAILSLIWYLESPSKRKKIVLILTLGISSITHPFTGILILGTSFLFLINFKKIKETIFIMLARKNIDSLNKTVLRGTILTLLGLLFYFFTAVFYPLTFFYINGFPYYWALIYMLPFLALITTISIKALTNNLPKIYLWLCSSLVLLLLLGLAYYPLKDKTPNFKPAPPIYKESSFYKGSNWNNYINLLGPPPGDNQYRYLQVPSDEIPSLYLNVFYDVPDFREGASSKGLGTKWVGLTMQALARNGKGKFFYLDWFAIKYLINIGDQAPDLVKNPEVFTAKIYDKDGNPFAGYINDPKTILEASTSPNVLLIGKDYAYEAWIEELSFANINPSYLIPVKGPTDLSEISLSELSKFDVVWIYGYEYKENQKSRDLEKLAKYVQEGGGLVIDTGFGPDSKAQNLPDPFPISQTMATSIKGEWQIEKVISLLATDVNFSLFSPPIYKESRQEYSWEVSTTRISDIKPWAKLALTTQGNPIVVVGEFGKGTVVWTGLNLNYHMTQYQNEQESLFLKDLLTYPVKDKYNIPTKYESRFINPEKRQVEIYSPSRGVIFRENFYPNWEVKVNSKRQPLYIAGPALMS